ncbi:MAG: PLP-dependent transferase, partial [Treponema sp.]|nr:PLP-dependent transferase [Treponema sp.]
MSLSIETKCVHLEKQAEDDSGKSPCGHYGAISFPIYQTATYAHPGVGKSTGFDYSRLQNPTREQLEKVVCQLEGGSDAFALSSGMAAITLLMEIFKPGDHIIVDADLYGGTIRLFDNVSVKNGIQFTRANCSQDDIESLIQPQTKA